ncbi:MAG: 30S ribosomal protein S12 methylthiotransferase RimO [Clostridia bacterium]|nr:30S ribosomal protein S12 methylthiotransferase RimO [Clostridia bacterium]
MKQVCIIALGCPKNIVDSEHISADFAATGRYQLTNDQTVADVVLVNTCAFIGSAREEAVEAILGAAETMKPDAKLVVTGCMAQMYGEIIREEMPRVDFVFGTGTYDDIIATVEGAESEIYEDNHVHVGDIFDKNGPVDLNDLSYLDRENMHSTGTYAFLKIADGCNNACSYCVIPHLKGRYRSRKYESVIAEAKRLAEKGVKEIILVAQDTTRYGLDLYKKRRLPELMDEISNIDGIEWIRVLYTYPEQIDDNLIAVLKNNPKVCKYLDIPIQHINDRILKDMRRRGDSALIKSVLTKLRQEVPGIVLRTSLIAGYPTETEEEIQELISFVSEGWFDRLGAFAYSREDGTPAGEMKGQIPSRTKEARARRIMRAQHKVACAKNKARVGKTYRTITEGVADDGIFYYGRTYGEAPDIDDYVYFVSPEPLEMGDMVDVYIQTYRDYELIGEVR